MNSIWYKIVLFGLLLMSILVPFAGFKPLLLIILIAGTYWFVAPVITILIFGKSEETD